MKKIIITSLLITLLMPSISAQAATKSLKTKGNKTSCKNIKTSYQSEAMSKWSNGLVGDQYVLEEIDSNIKMLVNKKKPTTGKLKILIGTWIKTEKDTKTAILDKSVEKITSAMNLKISVISNFDKICKSIEK